MAPLNIQRSKPSVLQFQDFIYVLGGISNHENIFNVPCERYDIQNDAWKIIDYEGFDIPFLTSSACLNKCWGAQTSSNLYILGGSNYEFPTYFVQ